MKPLSSTGHQIVSEMAQRHGFSTDAVIGMLESVIRGNGNMAQFNHPEFSGSGQWMSGGMTMVSDMFNNHLKGRVNSLCSELSQLVANQPDLLSTGSFQSQNQGNQEQYSHTGDQASNLPMNPSAGLFLAPAPGTSYDWWPSDLRWPTSTGAQNGMRYAYFAQARRLAIKTNDSVWVYDTQGHQIGGFSQQQSSGDLVTFSSQYGLVDVTRLPVISIDGVQQGANTGHSSSSSSSSNSNNTAGFGNPQTSATFQPESQTGVGQAKEADADIFQMIEKLADLKSRSIISEDEFNVKKTELLARL